MLHIYTIYWVNRVCYLLCVHYYYILDIYCIYCNDPIFFGITIGTVYTPYTSLHYGLGRYVSVYIIYILSNAMTKGLISTHIYTLY